MNAHVPVFDCYQDLLTSPSERQCLTMARQFMHAYKTLDRHQKMDFFSAVATRQIWGYKGLCLLQAPPDHTMKLIQIRQDLLDIIPQYPRLKSLDIPFKTFLQIVFNRCFLRFEPIVWGSTPPSVLQKIISYEAIHHIDSLDDLKNRLIWSDRLMYAYFHPLLGDEPLIFTEVALMQGTPHTAQAILTEGTNRKVFAPNIANTAVFYSISKSHRGLTGIRFGNLLIKQVVRTLKATYNHIDTFITLSPIPHLVDWANAQPMDGTGILNTDEVHVVRLIDGDMDKQMAVRQHAPIMKKIIAKYIVYHTPPNRVAHFHLGNGAEFNDIQILADTKRMDESYGCMVNYRYRLDTVEENIVKYTHHKKIPISNAICDILQT